MRTRSTAHLHFTAKKRLPHSTLRCKVASMPQSSDAEDHLRIIRSLMEKATIYRAISAQAALIGGVLAGVAGGLLAGRNDPFVKALASSEMHSANAEVYGFQLKWIFVLALCLGANLFFLYRDAQRRAEP